MQDKDYQVKGTIASGANGTVLRTVNPFFPGAVLKTGPAYYINEEGNFLHRCRHPNIVTMYAKVQADTTGHKYCLVLEPLGMTLQTLMAQQSRYARL